jgi:hypothetical protein
MPLIEDMQEKLALGFINYQAMGGGGIEVHIHYS